MIVVRTDEPFAIVPMWLIERGNPRATQVYAAIASFADKTGECYPSKATIAEVSGLDERTVQRAIHDLQEMGALVVTRRARKNRSTASNLYVLVRRNPVSPEGGKSVSPLGTNLSPLELDPMNKTKELSGKVEREFDMFWAVYPRKEGKPSARKALAKALKAGAHIDCILDGVERYAFSPDRKFQPLPATWLNDERWVVEQESVFADRAPIVGSIWG